MLKKEDKKYPDSPVDEEAFRLKAAKVASILARGGTRAEVQRELGNYNNGTPVNWRTAQKVIESPECQDILRTLVNEVIDQAKKSVRHQTAQLVPELIETLKHNLKKRNINAVPHVLKILDFDKGSEEQKDTSITIVLPGQEAPKDITPIDVSQIVEPGE